jgi:hypothetical protein
MPSKGFVTNWVPPPNAGTAKPQPPPPPEAPPLEAPPLEAPPLEAPPLEAPPLEAPPLEAPPLEAPPLEAPPLEAPPLEAPPLDVPPVPFVDPARPPLEDSFEVPEELQAASAQAPNSVAEKRSRVVIVKG